MKKLKSLKFIGILFLFAILVAGCSTTSSTSEGGESTLEKIKNEGKVVVGFAGEVPYAYEDEDGNLTGEAVEVARAIFKEMGIEEMEGKLVKFGSLIPGLQNGTFDVITAGMYITPERAAEVAFANPDYKIGPALAVQKGNPLDLHSYEDIAANSDVKVAVMNGAIEIDYMKDSGIQDNQLEIVQDIPSVISALNSGRVDAITMTGPTLESALETTSSENIERVDDFSTTEINGESVIGYGAAAFRKGDDELREAYNEELQKLKDSGQLLEIISEFGFTEQNLPGDITLEDLVDKLK